MQATIAFTDGRGTCLVLPGEHPWPRLPEKGEAIALPYPRPSEGFESGAEPPYFPGLDPMREDDRWEVSYVLFPLGRPPIVVVECDFDPLGPGDVPVERLKAVGFQRLEDV